MKLTSACCVVQRCPNLDSQIKGNLAFSSYTKVYRSILVQSRRLIAVIATKPQQLQRGPNADEAQSQRQTAPPKEHESQAFSSKPWAPEIDSQLQPILSTKCLLERLPKKAVSLSALSSTCAAEPLPLQNVGFGHVPTAQTKTILKTGRHTSSADSA